MLKHSKTAIRLPKCLNVLNQKSCFSLLLRASLALPVRVPARKNQEVAALHAAHPWLPMAAVQPQRSPQQQWEAQQKESSQL